MMFVPGLICVYVDNMYPSLCKQNLCFLTSVSCCQRLDIAELEVQQFVLTIICDFEREESSAFLNISLKSIGCYSTESVKPCTQQAETEYGRQAEEEHGRQTELEYGRQAELEYGRQAELEYGRQAEEILGGNINLDNLCFLLLLPDHFKNTESKQCNNFVTNQKVFVAVICVGGRISGEEGDSMSTSQSDSSPTSESGSNSTSKSGSNSTSDSDSNRTSESDSRSASESDENSTSESLSEENLTKKSKFLVPVDIKNFELMTCYERLSKVISAHFVNNKVTTEKCFSNNKFKMLRFSRNCEILDNEYGLCLLPFCKVVTEQFGDSQRSHRELKMQEGIRFDMNEYCAVTRFGNREWLQTTLKIVNNKRVDIIKNIVQISAYKNRSKNHQIPSLSCSTYKEEYSELTVIFLVEEDGFTCLMARLPEDINIIIYSCHCAEHIHFFVLLHGCVENEKEMNIHQAHFIETKEASLPVCDLELRKTLPDKTVRDQGDIEVSKQQQTFLLLDSEEEVFRVKNLVSNIVSDECDEMIQPSEEEVSRVKNLVSNIVSDECDEMIQPSEEEVSRVKNLVSNIVSDDCDEMIQPSDSLLLLSSSVAWQVQKSTTKESDGKIRVKPMLSLCNNPCGIVLSKEFTNIQVNMLHVHGISWSQFQRETMRLASFGDYPTTAAKSSSLLASSGFVYVGDGLSDRVKCFFCLAEKENWTLDDNIDEVHKTLSPACPAVIVQASNNVASNNVPLNNVASNTPLVPDSVWANFSSATPFDILCSNTAGGSINTPGESIYDTTGGSINVMTGGSIDTTGGSIDTIGGSINTTGGNRNVTTGGSINDTTAFNSNRSNYGYDDVDSFSVRSSPPIQPIPVPSTSTVSLTCPSQPSPRHSHERHSNLSNQNYQPNLNPEPASNTDQGQHQNDDINRHRGEQWQHTSINSQIYSIPAAASYTSSLTHEEISQNTQTASETTLAQNSLSISESSQLPSEADRSSHQLTYQMLGIFHDRPKHPEFAVTARRQQSFENWPESHPISAEKLVQSGLYYAGYGDCCRCFFCGGGLRNWETGDDPFVEHARWFWKCGYILQLMGQDFVQAVQQLKTSGGTITLADVTEYMENQGQCLRNFDDSMITDDAAVKSLIHEGYDRNKVITAALSLRRNGEILSADIVLRKVREDESAASGVLTESSSDDGNLQTLKEQNYNLRNNFMCKICMDKEVKIVFLPCGHLVSCPECAIALQDCPVCRSHIRARVRANIS